MALNPELTLQDYWRIIHRRRALFLLTWVLVALATAIFTELQTPVYRAQAVVKIEPFPSIPGLREERALDMWTLMNTEVKSVKSTSVSLRAAHLLGWVKEGMSQEDSLRLAGALQAQIQSERVGESNLIQVSVLSDKPQRAAALANAVTRAYIEKGMEDRSLRAREARDFTFQEMRKAEDKLRAAEETMKTYSERTGARGLGTYLTNELVTMQTRQDDLLKHYTAQHPDVAATRAKIVSVEKQIRDLPETETEYQRLAREVRINEELYTFLSKKYKESQIAEAEREQMAFIDSPALVPESPVRPDKVLNLSMGLLIGFFLGLVTVLIVENLDTSIGTIEDVERYVELPVLAVVPHIRDQGGGGGFFHFPSRGGGLDEMRRRLVMYHPTQSSFAEAYHTLRTNLRFNIRPGGRPGPVVGFTSAGASEGKTLTAVNFALTAAESGLKTLFIEADLRRPFAHKLLGLPREPGLSDCIQGRQPWTSALRGTSDFLFGDLKVDSVVKAPGIENFRLMPCGPAPMNPADVLGSPRLDALLKEVRAQFDLVVIDCAPVMLFADALLVGPKTDAIVLVHKAGVTARGALKRAKDQLVNVKSRVAGVVLNDLRASEMQPQYGYYYTYDYKSTDTPRGR